MKRTSKISLHQYPINFRSPMCTFLFLYKDTSTPKIYTLSLHDALPIFREGVALAVLLGAGADPREHLVALTEDRKSTRLNSSHVSISYAVFCLKKKSKFVGLIV